MSVLPADDPSALAEATLLLDAREAVVVPTDTLYALAADALDDEAVLRVFDLKGRAPAEPLPVFVGSVEDARHVARMTPLARRLAAEHWPGPLTLVLPAIGTTPDVLTAGGDTVAVRVPGHAFARALAAHFGPIVGTSANRAGSPPPATVADARAQFGSRVPLYVDGGRAAGAASTLVDATGDAPRLLREGAAHVPG